MTASAKKPNVLLITTDQQRFDALGINSPSSPLQTPILDNLAATGVNFTRAYTTCPVCIPARRSLLTGLHPVTHGLRGYRDGLEWDPPFTLPGLLGQAGYQTELIGKLHLFPQRKRYGFDHQVRTESLNDRWDSPLQKVNDWADWLKSKNITEQPNNIGINGNGRIARPWNLEEQYHQTSYLADQAVEFITKRRDPSCPYFMHLSFWAPHPPLIPPQFYWDKYYRQHDYKPTMSDWTPIFESVPRWIKDDSAIGPFERQEINDAASGYFGLINHIDDKIRHVLGRIFEYGMERAGEPTVIIFTSDHGEMLGDHHLFRKALPYEGSAHVPFFIAWKNLDFTPGTSDALVSLEDVCATVLELCGVSVPELLQKNTLDSQSLVGAMQGEDIKPRETLFGECSGFSNHFLVEGDTKYIWYQKTGEEQLFNLKTDPGENSDLSGDGSLLEPFREKLSKHLDGRDDYNFDREALKPCANKPPKVFWG